MARKRTFTDQIREAVKASGYTRYRIAQETGIGQDVLCRFVAGDSSLREENMNTLTAFLGLEVVRKGKGR